MSNNMTVEGLIELLKEEYPQSIVVVEEPPRYSGMSRRLVPVELRPGPRRGCVYIVCEEHYGKRG